MFHPRTKENFPSGGSHYLSNALEMLGCWVDECAWSRPRISGKSVILELLLFLNSQKILGCKENTIKYSNFSWSPRSHARILIYWTWRIDRAISLLRINYFNHMSWLPAAPLSFYKANNQTKEKESRYCQEWDSNPRFHSETRTPAPIVCWEGMAPISKLTIPYVAFHMRI